MKKRIGRLGNCYGGVIVKEENGKYYWGIDNYDKFQWEEITENLYTSLCCFEDKI